MQRGRMAEVKLDLVLRCKSALAFAKRGYQGPNVVQDALDALSRDQTPALASLDDPARMAVVLFLERWGLAHQISPTRFAALADALPAPGVVQDYRWLDKQFIGRWAAEVAGQVNPTRLSNHRAIGGGNLVTRQVKALIDQGDVDRAVQVANTVCSFDKGNRGVCFAHLGLALSSKTWLLDAVKAAKAAPQIQDGGEEAEALAQVLGVFATQLAADHPAVEKCIAALMRLGKKRARKDVRSFGLMDAALVAVQQGTPVPDAGWLDHIRTLLTQIWTESLVWNVHLNLARRYQEAGEHAVAEGWLAQMPGEPFQPPALRTLFDADAAAAIEVIARGRDPLLVAVALVEHGLAQPSALSEAIDLVASRYRGLEKAYGLIRPFKASVAASILDRIEDKDRHGDAHAAAALGLYKAGKEQQAIAELGLAIDCGWNGGFGEQAPILISSRALLTKMDAAVAAQPRRSDRQKGWLTVADGWISHNEWDKAAKVMMKIAVPTEDVASGPWVPYYRRGRRSNWTPDQNRWPLTGEEARIEDFEAQLTELADQSPRERSKALVDLMHQTNDIQQRQQILTAFAKTPGGRGDDAQAKKMRLGWMHLGCGQLDKALKIATSMRDCRTSKHGPSYLAEVFGAYFQAHPTSLTADIADQVMGLFMQCHPQETGAPLVRTLPSMMKILGGLEAFEAGLANIRTWLRSPGDAFHVDLAIAVGWAELGLHDRAKAGFERALEGFAEQRTIYLTLDTLSRAVGRALSVGMDSMLPSGNDLREQALRMLDDKGPVDRTKALGRSARILWTYGEFETLPQMVQRGQFPTEVCANLRRTLVVDGLVYAPNPLAAVVAAFSDQPRSVAEAEEQICALIQALKKAGRPEAEALERLFNGHQDG